MNSPFTLITEPTAVQRILLTEGLTDLATEIKGDGFAFVPIEFKDHWGLVIAAREPDGKVSSRVCVCKKEVGERLVAERFAAIMEHLSDRAGYPLMAKLETMNRN